MKMAFFFFLSLPGLALAKEYTVEMKSISFSPKVLSIAPGDTVVWKNVAFTDHSATGQEFDTGLIHPKATTRPVAFSKTGSFDYNCKVHGKAMIGTIVVGEKK